MDATSAQPGQVRRERFASGGRAIQLERRTISSGAKFFWPLRLWHVDQPNHAIGSRGVSRRRGLDCSPKLEQEPDWHAYDQHGRGPDSDRQSGETIKVVVTRRIFKVLLLLLVAWFLAWITARAS